MAVDEVIYSRIVFTVVAGVFVVISYTYIFEVLIKILLNRFLAYFRRRESVLSFIYVLYTILWMLESDNGGRWSWRWSVADRAKLMAELDDAAAIAGRSFFSKFSTRHEGVRKWRDDLGAKLENSLRQKQIWLMTPRRDTKQVLLTELSHLLTVVMIGNWDELKFCDDPEVRSAIWRPYQRAFWLVKAVFTSVSPLTVYLCIKEFIGIQLISPWESYVQTGLVIWTVVSILSIVDPLLKDKITSVKDILSIAGSEKK
jgi:hypothetical protein